MSSKGMRILKFKDEYYDYETLIMYFCEDVYGEKFKTGEVLNEHSGEIFDISAIIDNYTELNRGVLGELLHLTYPQRSRFKAMIETKLKEYRTNLFNKKLEEDTITKEELEELFIMVDNRDIKKEFDIRKGIEGNLIEKFVKINLDNPLPREITISDVGRFHRLTELIVNENKIFKRPHGNSNPINRSDLLEYLRCGNTVYKTFLKTMDKYNLIRKWKLPNNRTILFINPLYAHKDLVISKELYQIFKDVIDEKLDKKISKYMEFIYSDVGSNGCISYIDK